jgi:hypothetical protein
MKHLPFSALLLLASAAHSQALKQPATQPAFSGSTILLAGIVAASFAFFMAVRAAKKKQQP